MLSVDSSSCTELVPFLRHIFSSLVIAQSLDFAVQLVLSKSFELFERIKGTRLVFERENGPETRKVVNEGDPVPGMMPGMNWEGAMHIRVNELQRLSRASRGYSRDSNAMLLAS